MVQLFPDAKKLRGKENFLAWRGVLMALAARSLCNDFLDPDPANHPVEPAGNGAAQVAAHDKWLKRKADARCLLLDSVTADLDWQVNLPNLPVHTILAQLTAEYETNGGPDHLRLTTKLGAIKHIAGQNVNTVLTAFNAVFVALAAMNGNHAVDDASKVLKVLTELQNDPDWTDKCGSLMEQHADRNAAATAAEAAVLAAGGNAAAAAAAGAGSRMSYADVKTKLIADQERRSDIEASRSATPAAAAAAFAAAAAGHGERLPQAEWIAQAECHNCHARGHLAADCPAPCNKPNHQGHTGKNCKARNAAANTRTRADNKNNNNRGAKFAAAVNAAIDARFAAAGATPTPASFSISSTTAGAGPLPSDLAALLTKYGYQTASRPPPHSATPTTSEADVLNSMPSFAGAIMVTDVSMVSNKSALTSLLRPTAVMATAPAATYADAVRRVVRIVPMSTPVPEQMSAPTAPAPSPALGTADLGQTSPLVTPPWTHLAALQLDSCASAKLNAPTAAPHLVDLKLDSCASEHFLTNDFASVLTALPANGTSSVTVANGEKICITGTGDAIIGVKMVGTSDVNRLHLENARLVPKIEWNLLSVRRLTQHGGGLSVTFLPGGTTVEIRDKCGRLVATGTASDAEPLYKITANIIIKNAINAHAALLPTKPSPSLAGPAMYNKPKSTFASGSQSLTERTANVQRDIERTHKRLAHASIDKCKKILIHQYAADGTLNLELVKTLKHATLPFCEGCQFAKQKRTPLTGPAIGVQHEATGSIEWQHTDMGSMGSGVDGKDTIGYGGERYFQVIVDGKDKMGHVILLKTKGATELFPPFVEYIRFIENQHDRHVKVIQSDGGEMTADLFVNFCKEKGIFRLITPAGVPKRNPVAERRIGVLENMTAALLIESSLPLELWPDALIAANDIYNILPQTGLNEPGDSDISPHEARYGSPPDTRYLRVFGCPGYLLERRDETVKQREKLGQKSLKIIHLGTAPNGQGYKVFDPVTRKAYAHEFVEFDEDFDTAAHQGRIVRLANGQSIIGTDGRTVVEPVTIDAPPVAYPAPLDSVAPLLPPERIIQLHRDPVLVAPAVPAVPSCDAPNEPPGPIRIDDSPSLSGSDAVKQPSPLAPAPVTIELRRSTRIAVAPSPQTSYRVVATKGFQQSAAAVVANHDSGSVCSAADNEWESNSRLPNSNVISSTHAAAATHRHRSFQRHGNAPSPTRPNPLRTLDERGMFPDEPREPASIADLATMSDGEQVKWWNSMREENDGLVANNTWTLRPRGPRDRPIPGKWVWKLKRDAATGAVARYKARWVVKGFMQVKGRDYNETFAPCPRMQTFRLFCAIANAEDLDINMDDVSQAFLNGDMGDEKVTVMQPTGFAALGKETEIGDLNKGLYGTMQGARNWSKKIDGSMKAWGYTQNQADPCFYTERDANNRVIGLALIWVDDIINVQWITAAAPGRDTLSAKLAQKYKTTSGPLKTFCGMRVQRDRANRRLFLSQTAMIDKMLSTYNMQDCDPVSTPMPVGTKLSKTMSPQTDEEKLYMASVPYRELVGELGWIAQCTRADVKFVVGVLARFVTNPGKKHWEAAKYLLRYLAGTREYGLLFAANGDELTRDADGNLCMMKPIEIYCDADYAGDPDKFRSTTGFAAFACGGLFDWGSHIQQSTARSSAEAELMSLCDGVQEGECTSHTLKDAGIRVIKPHKLWEDNQAAIAVSKDVRSSKRTKHMEVRYFYTRDVIKSGRAMIDYCSTRDMVADILTKPLAADQFRYLRSKLGVVEWDKDWNEDSGSTDSDNVVRVAAAGVHRFERRVVHQIARRQ